MAEQNSPLSSAVFYVLLTLADGDKHGYAILKEVEHQTDGEVQLSTGTLYGIIKRLLENDLIKEIAGSFRDNDDSRRRYYRLTEAGRALAVTEARRLEKMVLRARSKRLIGKLGTA